MKQFAMSSVVVGLCALGVAAASAQEGMPEMPKPSAEHEWLAKDVGEWDATVKMWMDPSQPPTESKATEKVSMIGGFWQVSRFKSEFMGEPFAGMSLVGWDAGKKHYVSSWVDSTSPAPTHGTATYDAATRTLKGTMNTIGPDGKPAKMSETVVWKDDDTRVFTMATVGPDGKELTTMEITYTRKKK